MKHTIYEDPITRKFAFVRLPPKFADGDKLTIPPIARWFSTRDEAVAALQDFHLWLKNVRVGARTSPSGGTKTNT